MTEEPPQWPPCPARLPEGVLQHQEAHKRFMKIASEAAKSRIVLDQAAFAGAEGQRFAAYYHAPETPVPVPALRLNNYRIALALRNCYDARYTPHVLCGVRCAHTNTVGFLRRTRLCDLSVRSLNDDINAVTAAIPSMAATAISKEMSSHFLLSLLREGVIPARDGILQAAETIHYPKIAALAASHTLLRLYAAALEGIRNAPTLVADRSLHIAAAIQKMMPSKPDLIRV